MKFRVLLLFLGTLSLCLKTHGVSLWDPIPSDLYIGFKASEYRQTAPGVVFPYGGDPYEFEIAVFPGPMNTSVTATPFFQYEINSTPITQPLTVDNGSFEFLARFSSLSEMELDFPDGTEYTLTIEINGTEETVVFTIDEDGDGNTFFPQPEVISLVNAVWVDGFLVLDPNQLAQLGLNSSVLVDFEVGVDALLIGTDNGTLISRFPASEITIGPGGDLELAPGFHNLMLDYVNVLYDFPEGSPITGFQGFAGYISLTEIQVYVIPEPSTYGLIAGGVIFCGVLLYRRRKAAKTPRQA